MGAVYGGGRDLPVRSRTLQRDPGGVVITSGCGGE